MFRWAFAGLTALMVGLGFAALSGNLVMAAVSASLVFLVVAYLFREKRSLGLTTSARRGGTGGSAEAGYVSAHDATAVGDYSNVGDCGPGGDGGGSFGGDGGGAGGC